MENDPINTDSPFAAGTLVRLKSGGPAMTVLGESKHAPFVVCCWFWRGKYYENEFYAYALTDDLDAPILPLEHECADQANAGAGAQPAGAEK